ncbi:MAG: peptidylprolyl isomerase [Elusimicrobia bacterium]|nr:peptidylprolyl isomerase [Elusimicrobiota bacterium]
MPRRSLRAPRPSQVSLGALSLLLAAGLLAACGKSPAPAGDGKTPFKPRPGARFAVLKTSKGTIKAMLYAREVPATVAVFTGLAEGTRVWTDPKTGRKVSGKRYYDGLTFHRVVPGFMIQTGDPTAKGGGGAGFTFKDEFRKDLKFDRPGMLGMANWGPDTGNGQFFITLASRPDLNGMHTVFGEVISGLSAAHAIAEVPRDEFDSKDKPLKPVYLESVTVKDKP